MAETLKVATEMSGDIAAKLKEMQSALADLKSAGDKGAEGVEHVDKANKEAKESSGGLAESLKHVAETAAGLLGADALEGLADKLKESASAAVDLSTEVKKLSMATGMSAEDSSKLAFAAEETGVQFTSLMTGVDKLQKALAGYDEQGNLSFTTSKAMTDNFTALGISVYDAAGKQLPFNDILGQTADVFRGMPDGVQKTALAMQLFGRGGVEMIPILNQGKEGLAELGDEAEKYGLVLDGPTQDALRRQVQAHREFEAAIKGIQVQLGIVLTPILAYASKSLAELAVAFREHVIPAIQDLMPHLQNAAEQLKDALPGAISTVLDVMTTFVDGMNSGIVAIESNWPVLVEVVAGAMSAIAQIVGEVGQEIYSLLQWINPFASHSPPLVDQVSDGVQAINESFAKLASVNDSLASAEGAVRAFTDAMQGTSDTLDAADLATKLEAIRRTGGEEAVSAYGEASAALDTLRDNYSQLGTQLGETQTSFDNLSTKLDTEKGKLQDLQDKVNETKKTFDDFRNTPLLEEKKFDDASAALKTQMTQLQLQINHVKESGQALTMQGSVMKDGKMVTATVDTAAGTQLKALEAQLAQLQLKASDIDLNKSLAIDPLKDKLDALNATAPLPFDQIYKGAQDAKAQLATLTGEMTNQQTVVDKTQSQYDTMKTTLDEQKKSYQDVGKQIDDNSKSLDAYVQVATKTAAAEDARVKAAEAAAKAEASAATSAASKAAAAAKAAPPEFGSGIPTGGFDASKDLGGGKGALDDIKSAMDNTKQSIADMKQSFSDLKDSLHELGDNLSPVKDAIEEVGNWLADHPDVWQTFAIGVGTATVALGLFNIVGGIAAGVMTILTSPLLLTVVAIGLVAVAIYELNKHWDEIVAKYPIVGTAMDTLRTSFEAFVTWIKDPFIPTVQSIYDKVSTIVTNVVTFVTQNWHFVQDAIEPIVVWIGTVLAPALLSIATTVIDVVTRSVNWVVDNWDTIWKTINILITTVETIFKPYWLAFEFLVIDPAKHAIAFIVDHWDQIQDAIGHLIKWVADYFKIEWAVFETVVIDPVNKAILFVEQHWDQIQTAIEKLTTWATDFFKGAWNDFTSYVTDPIEAAIRWVADNIGRIMGPLGKITDAIDKVKGFLGGGGDDSAVRKELGLPMAAGGLVTQPTLALIGEAGPELVIPLSAISSLGGQRGITDHSALGSSGSSNATGGSHLDWGVSATERGKQGRTISINGNGLTINLVFPAVTEVTDPILFAKQVAPALSDALNQIDNNRWSAA